jgi:hypothetical protein
MGVDKLRLISPSDKLGEVLEFYQKGGNAGDVIGFYNLETALTFGDGVAYDFSGAPTSGKTQFVFEMLLNVSQRYGYKHVLFMPDAGSQAEIIAKLIHKRTGKTFDKRYKNAITDREIMEEIGWIDEHFIFLDRKSWKDKITPIDVWEYAAKMRLKDELIKSVVIDSWKDLYHDIREFGRDDMYLAYVLRSRNDLARKSGMNIITIIHPVKPQKSKDGKMLPFNAYDLKGGSEWFNNGQVMVFINRPDKDTNVTEVDVRKAKPEGIGKEGVYYLYYDFAKSRYYEMINSQKSYAWDYRRMNLDESKAEDLFTNETDEIPF